MRCLALDRSCFSQHIWLTWPWHSVPSREIKMLGARKVELSHFIPTKAMFDVACVKCASWGLQEEIDAKLPKWIESRLEFLGSLSSKNQVLVDISGQRVKMDRSVHCAAKDWFHQQFRVIEMMAGTCSIGLGHSFQLDQNDPVASANALKNCEIFGFWLTDRIFVKSDSVRMEQWRIRLCEKAELVLTLSKVLQQKVANVTLTLSHRQQRCDTSTWWAEYLPFLLLFVASFLAAWLPGLWPRRFMSFRQLAAYALALYSCIIVGANDCGDQCEADWVRTCKAHDTSLLMLQLGVSLSHFEVAGEAFDYLDFHVRNHWTNFSLATMGLEEEFHKLPKPDSISCETFKASIVRFQSCKLGVTLRWSLRIVKSRLKQKLILLLVTSLLVSSIIVLTTFGTRASERGWVVTSSSLHRWLLHTMLVWGSTFFISSWAAVALGGHPGVLASLYAFSLSPVFYVLYPRSLLLSLVAFVPWPSDNEKRAWQNDPKFLKNIAVALDSFNMVLLHASLLQSFPFVLAIFTQHTINRIANLI